MRKNFLVTPIAMLLVSGAMPLSAQDLSTGTVAGRVTGANGQPLQGVHIQLNSPSLLAPRQFTTDANGQFRAQMLMGGNYTITYSITGYLTRRMNTYVTPGQTIRGDMQLKPVDVQIVEVEISASGSQQVDKTDTVTQTSYSQEKLRELFGSASVANLVALSPAVISDGNDFRIRGGTQRGTKMMVDGGNVTNMAEGTGYAVRYPMTDAVESIAIIQSPLNARYGNTDSGLVSVVLSKGSNDFKGTLRVSPGRGSIWNVSNPGYPNNRGESATFNPGSDTMSKTYQMYLSGPLVKNYVTFSWTSENTPTLRSTIYQYQSTGDIWVTGDGSSIDPARYRVGTYYQNPATGEVIRKAEMLDASDPMNAITSSTVNKNDTYTLFYQITQNHQLEWSYSEAIGNRYNVTNYKMADMSTNPVYADTGWGLQRRWNLAYKGIIGTSGILEARMSSSTQSWFNLQVDGRPKHSVRVYTMPSYYPINGINNGDPANYYASGLIDGYLQRQDDIKDSRQGGHAIYDFNATNEGPGDTAKNEPVNINYQHILETSLGQHIIDVGFQRERSAWVNPNIYNAGGINAERLIYSPGRIATDLQPGDIYNYAGTPISQYAGKFIVYNMNYATFNSIDPYGFSRFNRGEYSNEPSNGNMRLIDYNNGAGYGKNLFWPMMYEQYGGTYTDFYVQQTSYYINDIWSINNNHSVMGGMRYDMYNVWDTASGKDIHSYNLPTFRLEYKWDIGGDQRRIFNVSWGQFHNMAPVSSWAAFVNRGVREMVWDVGPIDGKPYLVDFSDVMNKDNYRVVIDNAPGSVNEVASDFKGLVSNEFTVGIRLNLDNGGSVRATYVNRSWDNEYAYTYNGWKPNPNGNGTMVFSRMLQNLDGIERSYNSIELEWDVPVTRKVDFGGSYTFSRFMSNGADETSAPQKSANKSVYYWDAYNQFEYPHWGWNPVRLRDPEHRFRAYINYDLTYGNVKSNLAFMFSYTSAAPANRSYSYRMGYLTVPGITDNRAGEGMPSMPTNTGVARNRTVFYNIHRTAGPDSWDTNLAYNLDVPVTKKVHWFLTITSTNPFNHRGKSYQWYSIDGWVGSGSVVPETVYYSGGSPYITANNPYAIGGMKSDNVQNTNANLFAPNRVMGGRTIGLQTGLRF
jgi:hypothetical protein